jgi:hypothetical protein
MKRILGTTVAVLSLVLAATASASAGTESITTTTQITSFPSGPPNKQTYSATYTATGTFDDAGSVSIQALLGAVPSPTVGVTQSTRTYTSDEGHGTLVLRCTQLATAADFSLYPDVPDNGSCAVIAATGDFAGLFRSGTISGIAHFNSSGTGGTLIDTAVLGR